jgi:hypothetical protein
MIRSERKNVIQTVGTRVDVLQAGTLELYKRMLTAFYVEDGMKIFVRQGKFMRPPARIGVMGPLATPDNVELLTKALAECIK